MTFLDVARREAQDLKRRQSELDSRRLDVRGGASDPVDLAEIGERFQQSYASLGAGGSPAPLPSESPSSYRRRLASGLQHLSPAWRDADLHRADRDVIGAAEPQIIADVASAVADRTRGDSRTGGLREIKTQNAAGVEVTEFGGSPLVWMNRFMRPAFAVKSFRRPDGAPIRVNRRSV